MKGEVVTLPDSEICRRKFRETFKTLSDPTPLFLPDCVKAYKKGTLVYSEGTCMKGCYFVYEGVEACAEPDNKKRRQG